MQKEDFEEVDALLGVLRKALKDLIDAFGKYADVLGLSAKDMRAARQAAGMVDE